MRRTRLLVTAVVLALTLAVSPVAGPALAQPHINDLNGTWDFFAYGYYEVFTTFCHGTIRLEKGSIVAGHGSYHTAPATFRGHLALDENGLITGQVAGRWSESDSFDYSLVSGRANPPRDTIVASGQDHNGWGCIYYLVRID
jgi:hypothetical protein